MEIRPISAIRLAIPVASGTGSIAFSAWGKLYSAAFSPPLLSPSTVYDVDFSDSDGFGIAGRPALQGVTTFAESKLFDGNILLTISNATADGIYLAKIYIEPYI